MKKYSIYWQEWDGKNGVIHDYIEFDYDELLRLGRSDVLSRYSYCINEFNKLSQEKQYKGLIFGGVFFDFSIILKEE